ncbi:MAG: hypothetical protein ACFWUE_08365 [Xylanivirga thermophila]|jgi:hypothetical protein
MALYIKTKEESITFVKKNYILIYEKLKKYYIKIMIQLYILNRAK